MPLSSKPLSHELGTGSQLSFLSGRVDIWRAVAIFFSSALLIYLVAVPLFFLIYGSFSTAMPGRPGSLSTGKYAEVVTDPRSYRLMWYSFVYAAGSSVISFVIGAAIAWLVQRTDLPSKGLFTFLALFPLFMPTVLISVGWILLLDANVGLINRILQSLFGLESAAFDVFTLSGIIWVRGVIDVPLVFLWLWPAFVAMDPSLEEAAAMSRAGPATVVRTITLPLILPALAATFLISFVASIEDVTVPIFIGLPAGINVFASEIYLATTRVPSDIHAASVYAVALLGITVALTVIYRRLTYHTERYVIIRGRGYRPSLTRLGRARLPLTVCLSAVLAVIVGLPIFVLLWTSFSRYLQVPSLAGLRNLSWTWYQTLLVDPMVLRGFVNSTILGVTTGIVVMLLAMIVGWVVIRSRSRFGNILDFLAFMPIAIPGLVTGLSLMWLYLALPLPIYGTLWILIIAYVTRFIPYGVRLAYSGFSQLHPELEEAAYLSGSGWGKCLRTISLPLLAPTLTAGMIYVFLRAFRELPASLLLTSFGIEPYSVVAYHIWAAGESAKTAAYGMVAIIFMTAVVLGVQRLIGKRYFLQ